jgi:hypothetical protein
MPREVWGYRQGDHVEVRESFDGRWETGVIFFLTARRTLQVRLLEEGRVMHVQLPAHVRPWEKPQTAEEIERYLDG